MIIKETPGIIASAFTIGSLIFHAGTQANKIDELFSKAHAAEGERKESREILYDIHGKISGMEKDIEYIKKKI